METIISICLGIGLAASVGFRVFLPLFALSLASYFNVWELNSSWLWVGSLTAVIIFGVATIIEILGYYIPLVDNLLDTIAIPLAAVAGTAVMMSTVSDLSPVITWALAIIAGGGTAATIKSAAGSSRITSTVTTAGFGNPLVSTIETGTSIIMSIFSIFLPIIAFVLVIFVLFVIFKLYKKIRPSKP
ncbi:uncharacterized protein DUF4126 [Gelidibacter algens]|uniref:Uncharacterized protein DUF4126 n=1 Tax=Gelidibacter algens TaxID=49280 RepID=A0A1A7QYF4_9FLAO|nr:DUF4126 domain-containing protein [Gelidibacter algens]OBX25040.1 hypothetical protein A9996_12120 [Gelidibacter algens]RAJ26563.1 uncharacterized protein DUF4126 [Gelidibacter algens]